MFGLNEINIHMYASMDYIVLPFSLQLTGEPNQIVWLEKEKVNEDNTGEVLFFLGKPNLLSIFLCLWKNDPYIVCWIEWCTTSWSANTYKFLVSLVNIWPEWLTCEIPQIQEAKTNQKFICIGRSRCGISLNSTNYVWGIFPKAQNDGHDITWNLWNCGLQSSDAL